MSISTIWTLTFLPFQNIIILIEKYYSNFNDTISSYFNNTITPISTIRLLLFQKHCYFL